MICLCDKCTTFPGNASEEKPEVTITEGFFLFLFFWGGGGGSVASHSGASDQLAVSSE